MLKKPGARLHGAPGWYGGGSPGGGPSADHTQRSRPPQQLGRASVPNRFCPTPHVCLVTVDITLVGIPGAVRSSTYRLLDGPAGDCLYLQAEVPEFPDHHRAAVPVGWICGAAISSGKTSWKTWTSSFTAAASMGCDCSENQSEVLHGSPATAASTPSTHFGRKAYRISPLPGIRTTPP